MRFSVYFDSILNEKWLFSYKNNDISCTHARGHASQRENLEKMCNISHFRKHFENLYNFSLKNVHILIYFSMFIRQIISIVGNSKICFSLLHLFGL